MAITGTQGEFLSFEVTNAASVRSVAFGSGVVSGDAINKYQTSIEAQVPVDATYGSITFAWPDEIAIFETKGTGLYETGAWASLHSNVSSLTYDTVQTGQATYTNQNEASGVCILAATRSTQAEASGMVNDAWGSGFCGNNLDDYANGSYQISETRLSEISFFQDSASSYWAATAVVEYTGNFDDKIATAITTGTNTAPSANYASSFVPVPVVEFASNWQGDEGDSISLTGYGFAGLTGLYIGVASASFSISSAQQMSFTIPAGTLDDYITLYGQYGVVGVSSQKFISSPSGEADAVDASISFRENQIYYSNTLETDPITVFGKNISNLTRLFLTDPNDNETDVLAGATYTDSFVSVPITGLTEKSYDLTAVNSLSTGSVENVIRMRDMPFMSYSASIINSINFEYIGEHPTLSEMSSDLVDENFKFSLDQRVDEINVNFKSNEVTSGEATYELLKETSLTNLTRSYTIVGKGQNESQSKTNALSIYDNGTYTLDEFGDVFDDHSVYLDPGYCEITSSGSSVAAENPIFTKTGFKSGAFDGDPWGDSMVVGLYNSALSAFTSYQVGSDLSCVIGGSGIVSGFFSAAATGSGVVLTATGFSSGLNDTEILNQLTTYYQGYEITGKDVTTSTVSDSYSFKSGVSFPFSSSYLNDITSEPWANIWASGMYVVYPTGYPGGENLTSGFNVLTGVPITTGSLTAIGKCQAEALSSLETEIANNHSMCNTGSYTFSTSGETITISRTGYFYGYC